MDFLKVVYTSAWYESDTPYILVTLIYGEPDEDEDMEDYSIDAGYVRNPDGSWTWEDGESEIWMGDDHRAVWERERDRVLSYLYDAVIVDNVTLEVPTD